MKLLQNNIKKAMKISVCIYVKMFILCVYLICWRYFLIVNPWATKSLQLILLTHLSKYNYELLNLLKEYNKLFKVKNEN